MLVFKLLLALCLATLTQTYPYEFDKIGPLAPDIVDYNFYSPSLHATKKIISGRPRVDESHYRGLDYNVLGLFENHPTYKQPYKDKELYLKYGPETSIVKYSDLIGTTEAKLHPRPVEERIIHDTMEKFLEYDEPHGQTNFFTPLMKNEMGNYYNLENENKFNLFLSKLLDTRSPLHIGRLRTNINNPTLYKSNSYTPKSDSLSKIVQCIELAGIGQFPVECKSIEFANSIKKPSNVEVSPLSKLIQEMKNQLRITEKKKILNDLEQALRGGGYEVKTNYGQYGHEMDNRGRSTNLNYEISNKMPLVNDVTIQRREYAMDDGSISGIVKRYNQASIPKAPHDPIIEPDSAEDIEGNEELDHTTPVPTPESGEGPDRSQCYVGFSEYRFKGSDSCLAQIVPFTKVPFPKFTQSDLVIY